MRSLGDTPTGWGGPAAYRRSITRPMAFITKPALDRGMNEPCLSSLPGTFVFRRPDPPRQLTPRREGVWTPQTCTDEHRAPRADATHSGGAGRRCLVLSLSFSATRGPCHQGAAPSWLSCQPRSRAGLAGRVFLRVPLQAPSRAGPQPRGAMPPSRLSSVILTWPPRRCARDLGFSRVWHVSARVTMPRDGRRSHRSNTVGAERSSRDRDAPGAGCCPHPHRVARQSARFAQKLQSRAE